MLADINNLFLTEIAQSQISMTTVFLTLAISAVLGFAVSWVYQKTFKGASYSASFVSSLVLLTLITAIVMLVIGSNLARAFGLVGALSVIRFRTAVKDPKDISFIFLALVIGLASGTKNYHIAVSATVFTLALVYLLDRINYGSFANHQYFLTIKAKRDNFEKTAVTPLLSQYADEYRLNSVNSVFGEKDKLEMVYRVNIRREKAKTALLKALAERNRHWQISLISTENYIEY